MTPDGLDALRVIYEQAVNRAGPLTAEDFQEIMAENEELGHSLHLQTLAALSVSKGRRYGESRYSSIFNNGVVVIDLIGPIYPRANMMTASGATSIAQFTQEFIAAHEDPDVTGIVMNVDSPGGDVRGIGDAAMLMYGLSKKRKKPVKAFVSGYGASAAYYISAAAQEIVGSKSSVTGSIGVVLSAKAKGNGEYEITASKSPYKRVDPSTDEGQAVLREHVDDLADIFISDVAQFRGITENTVLEKYGQGKVIVGPRAKALGLIDKIGTLSSVVEDVAKEAQSGSYRQIKKRKVSAEAEALLSFTNEEYLDMGLKDLVKKFTASNETVLEDENDEQALSNPATDESEEAVAGNDEGQVKAKPGTPVITREQYEEQFSDAAELFATQMTYDNRIFPAQQAHAASDLLIAKIDDARYLGKVGFVNAEGEIVEGTREDAIRARYNAMPKHSMTKKAIAGVKEGSIAAHVLAAEDKEDAKANGPIDPNRRQELLSLTQQGRQALAQNK